jgi:PHS family inorganic phosphate transporter-like MFS transporter
MIVVAAYKNKILSEPASSPAAVDYCWRLLIGLGCVPGVIALYFRLTIPETPRFTLDIERNMKQAIRDVDGNWKGAQVTQDNSVITHKIEVPKASWADFRNHFGQWNNGKVLLGTAWSWFALDVRTFSFTISIGCSLSPSDRFLRSWPQLIHHLDRHRFRNTSIHRITQGL